MPISERYIAFATNVSVQQAIHEMSQIPREYRKRWGIEIAYRQVEGVRPWTTSPDEVYRVILFSVSLFMHNMWAIERTKRGVNPRDMTLNALAFMVFILILEKLNGVSFDPGGHI